MHDKRIRVLFFIPWLGGGGAERTFLNIINKVDRSRFEPVLVLCHNRGTYLELLASDVCKITLDVPLKGCILPLALKIIQLKPDIIISTMRFSNLAAVASAKLLGIAQKVVVRETNNLTAAGINPRHVLEQAVGWAYRSAGRVVALSEGVREDIISRYRVKKKKVKRIYNPVNLNQIHRLCRQEAGDDVHADYEYQYRIITIGKLLPQKGQDLLIRAMSSMVHQSVHLTILGEGPDREQLKALASCLKVSERVSFLGFKKNPYAYLRGMDLFVLPSRWEGFGHVIVEAMACGVPVLSADCPSGPSEIIKHGMNGILCRPDSASSLSGSIDELLGNQKLRQHIRKNALNTIERFEIGKIVTEYEDLFSEMRGDG